MSYIQLMIPYHVTRNEYLEDEVDDPVVICKVRLNRDKRELGHFIADETRGVWLVVLPVERRCVSQEEAEEFILRNAYLEAAGFEIHRDPPGEGPW